MYALSNSINWWLREVVYPHQGMGMVGGVPFHFHSPLIQLSTAKAISNTSSEYPRAGLRREAKIIPTPCP